MGQGTGGIRDRDAGATALAGISLGLTQNSTWYHRKWSATLRSIFDGLV